MTRISELFVGSELPGREFTITRADLIRYAGASGDFNVIHWNERVAREVGLPNVIAHGMFTMGLAVRIVTDWLGDPTAIVEYSCRFTRPVPVPDDNVGATLLVTAMVAEFIPENKVAFSLGATCDSVVVLGKARVIAQVES